MRRDALPALLRQARAQPIRAEIVRLEDELESLDEELARVQKGPMPEVPKMQRGHLTSAMMQRTRIGGVHARMTNVGREIREARSRLAELEAGGTSGP